MIPSNSLMSSGVSRRSTVVAFWRICSGRDAPAMTELTSGRASSQANANSTSVRPRSSTQVDSLSIRSKFDSLSRRSPALTLMPRRLSAGADSPRR